MIIRLEAIRVLMKQKRLKNYLEIGVHKGLVFFQVNSTFKIAVDPQFFFDRSTRLSNAVQHPCNLFNRYYEMKSDDFFAYHAPRVLARRKIDIAFIDGMH